MIRLLVLLCLAAAPAFGSWLDFNDSSKQSLKVKFMGFMDQPTTRTSAIKEGWEVQTKPALPSGYEALELWCPKNDVTLCIFYDDTEYVAGLQIAFNPKYFTGAPFHDWKQSGFTEWTVEVNGTSTTFWTIQQYYISTDDLATTADTRIAARKSSSVIQGKYIYVASFNSTLLPIPTEATQIERNTDFTKQACFPIMGHHYYYKMTKELECSVDTLLTWFPLVYDGQLIGMGFVIPGKYQIETGKTNPFENPPKLAIQMIVPEGPECLYELGDNPGLVTMHTYFISNPMAMTCIFNIG